MMPVKFKVGFTIDAQTLFAMMSKLLPVDDVTVEELIERPLPSDRLVLQPVPPGAMAILNAAKQQTKARLKPKQYKRLPRKPLDLHAGINRIIMEALSDGFAHRSVDFKSLLKKGGYSENSVGSRLQNLREHGVVEQMGDGTWRLANFPATATTGAGRE
jgi:hypothetical protein